MTSCSGSQGAAVVTLWSSSFNVAAADIVMTHVLAFVRDEALLGGLPHLTAYRARCMARPAYRRALAIQTEGKPA